MWIFKLWMCIVSFCYKQMNLYDSLGQNVYDIHIAEQNCIGFLSEFCVLLYFFSFMKCKKEINEK